MKKLTVLLLALIFSGCASVSGKKVDSATLESFKKGKTTIAEVVQAVGEPNSKSQLPDGGTMYLYYYGRATSDPKSMIPVVGRLFSGVDSESITYEINFDKYGKFERYAIHESQNSTHRSL